MKTKIKLVDTAFYPDLSSSKYHDSEFIYWDRALQSNDNDVIFFTDQYLGMAEWAQYQKLYKVAWLIEPRAIRDDTYKYILENYRKFDLVLSHHQNLVEKIPNAKWYPGSMSWVADKDWGKYDKAKLVSIITSRKNATKGHILRHNLIEKCSSLDVYGFGYKPIKHKIEALKDYRFSVAIENSQEKWYFTEKLLDCFATYTIPIYWGSPEIGKFFNTGGMIICNSLNELINAVDLLPSFDRNSLVEKALEENFNKAKEYKVAEDWIFKNILVPSKIV